MQHATGNKPTTVLEAKQVGEGQRYSWVEPAAWSVQMLETLERGVQGGKWYTLIDKIYRGKNLESAYKRVKRNGGSAGVDHVSTTQYGEELTEELRKLEQQLKTGTYEPQAIKRVYIPKAGGGERPLGIPTVRDRVVQAAVRQVIEPIYEHEFLPCSYGFRPERGCKDALRQVDQLMKQGYKVVVDADIKGYFDNIDHDILMSLVEERIKDSKVLDLIKAFLNQGVLEDGKESDPAMMGTPQGGVISPLLANIYLHELDKVVTERGYQLVRYADDFVIMCKTKQEAEDALALVRDIINKLKLTLHPDKTHIVDMNIPDEEFAFLGYRFVNRKGRTLRYPRDKSSGKLRDKIRTLTPRLNPSSLEQIIERLNIVLVGWYEYFKQSSKSAFVRVDQWVRSRLRSILRRRRKTGTRNRYGLSHRLWPNSYFHGQKLFCLTTAHSLLRLQSASR